MDNQPVSLDQLIGLVRAQIPDGDELGRLSNAVLLAGYVNDQADNLIGHFVDQARRSGASWSQIGTAMGVSKQAAQQRWVPRWGTDLVTAGRSFDRFTDRARTVLTSANRIAGGASAPSIGAAHLTLGLLSEPEGLAAKALGELAVDDAALRTAFAITTEPVEDVTAISFDDDAQAVLDATSAEALRLGHNFIGTEHILLGLVAVNGDVTARLAALGVSTATVEPIVLAGLQRILATRTA